VKLWLPCAYGRSADADAPNEIAPLWVDAQVHLSPVAVRQRVRSPRNYALSPNFFDQGQERNEWQALLSELKGGRYEADRLIDFVHVKEERALAFTDARLVYINLASPKAVWEVKAANLRSVHPDRLALHFASKERPKMMGVKAGLGIKLPVRHTVICNSRDTHQALMAKTAAYLAHIERGKLARAFAGEGDAGDDAPSVPASDNGTGALPGDLPQLRLVDAALEGDDPAALSTPGAGGSILETSPFSRGGASGSSGLRSRSRLASAGRPEDAADMSTYFNPLARSPERHLPSEDDSCVSPVRGGRPARSPSAQATMLTNAAYQPAPHSDTSSAVTSASGKLLRSGRQPGGGSGGGGHAAELILTHITSARMLLRLAAMQSPLAAPELASHLASVAALCGSIQTAAPPGSQAAKLAGSMQALCGSGAAAADLTAQRAVLSTLSQLCDSLDELVVAAWESEACGGGGPSSHASRP